MLFGTKDSCSSVCILLKSACLKLALMSSKRQNKQSVGKLPEHFLYTRMIWGMLHRLLNLFCNLQCCYFC